ncbi:hypothetical protein ATEIFO6365_0015017000 [Aspergillus terreus]|uniref:Uncharacterized protein n=1 Tax=Aspergillus terreus TaxID=33178 RepID=A0A5M3ZHB8_ASPTE|nr:hypothetical protein ATETN484_0016016900 [Aspergillus terreus]GFF21598.1 hypothetical protein ATEIFO6365_0015017000 [Aspergillus terreus]
MPSLVFYSTLGQSSIVACQVVYARESRLFTIIAEQDAMRTFRAYLLQVPLSIRDSSKLSVDDNLAGELKHPPNRKPSKESFAMVDGRRAAKIHTWLLRAMASCNEGGLKGADNTDLLQMGVSYSHSSRFLHHASADWVVTKN